jgi:hypothetical protein
VALPVLRAAITSSIPTKTAKESMVADKNKKVKILFITRHLVRRIQSKNVPIKVNIVVVQFYLRDSILILFA